MTPEEFIKWIEEIPLQTLTDELKEEIIENFNNINHGTPNTAREK